MSKETPVQKRPTSDIYTAEIDDGLQNVVSNLGTKKARDPYTRLLKDHRLDRIELEDIYRSYWIAKAVDVKPWDMTREWRTFSGDEITPDQIKAIEEEERKVDAGCDIREALKWASLYGGAGLVMHVNGHGLMEEPLDVTKIKKGQLNRLSPADRWELIPASSTMDYNPLSPTYGTAAFYRVATDINGQLIHRSRIIFFRGRSMPIRITRQLLGWGESDVQRWYKAITNNETLAAAIIEGVHQANIDVVSAKGLAETLAQNGGEKKIQDRFMTMDFCKSLLNMAVIDGDDTMTRNAFPFSGLPEIKKVFLEELASATDIPVTRLLGSSPGGMNATGESDTRNYYDMISAQQQNDLSPKLYQLDQVLIRSALGDYPEGLSFDFNPLWQMTPEEDATLKQTQVQTLISLQSIGVDDYTLQKDAIEMGLVKNLAIEDVEAAEKMDDFDVDPENDDFNPENEPEDDTSGGGGNDTDSIIKSLTSQPDGDSKKKDDGGSFNKVTSSGKRYRETSAGNRVYKDGVNDEIGFKEEKHKRDGGKFAKTEGGGSGGNDQPQGKTTAQKLVEARTGASSIPSTKGGGEDYPDHIKALKVPPAWKHVVYSDDPNADLLVIGEDAKGRKQRIYSKAFTERSSAAKFQRISALINDIKDIDKTNDENRADGVEESFVFNLIRKTGIRPGSDVDTKAKKQAYGATTLEGRHVVVGKDGGVTLKFTGKKGVDLSIGIDDNELSDELKHRKVSSGDDGRLFDTKATKLRAYSKSISGGKYKPKDLRTLMGTTIAATEVSKITEMPKTANEYKKIVRDIAVKVSAKLGNTPVIALQSYINPSVFEKIKVAA